MKHFELKGQIRQAGNKAIVKAFRRQNLVPCNLYGGGLEDNILFTVSEKDLKGLTHTPASYIVDLVIDGKTYQATAHEYQWHPVSDRCLHADFLAVDGKKPIVIDVPLKLTGHPVGVQAGGKFSQLARKVRVSASMEDLPDELTIDITHLGLDKRLTVADLSFDKITILSPKTTIICRVKTTRATQQTAAETETQGAAGE